MKCCFHNLYIKMGYKWCIVPQCTNTSIKTPDKLFVSVPQHLNARRTWLTLAGRNPDGIGTYTSVFCCEDHFDIEKDMANYMKYKMGFCARKLLKSGVVPSKFHCQEDWRKSLDDAAISRPAYKQRKKLDINEPETSQTTEGNMIQNGSNLESTTENRSNLHSQDGFAFVDCSKSVPEIEFVDTRVKSEPIYDFTDVSDNCYADNCNMEIKHEQEMEIDETRVKNEICDSTYDDRCALIVATNSSRSERRVEEKNSAVENVGVKPSRCYTCSVCDYKPISSYDLKMHMQMHLRTKEIRPHKCTMCPYAGLTVRKLEEHMKTHPQEILLKCNLCEYATTTYTKLMFHMKDHTTERTHKCTICSYASTKPYHLKMHMRTHTESKRYKCHNCQYACLTVCKLTEHMIAHHQEMLLKCTLCEYATTISTKLMIHMEVHTERTHQCTICSYAAAKPYHLKRHMTTHPEWKPYKCNKCRYAGVTKDTLNKHMKTHTEKTRIAEQNFSTENVDEESTEKCHTCNVCEYTTTTSNKLKMHMSTHAGEKLYNCTICQCAGLSKVKFKEHMKLHTGATLYKCSLSDSTAAHFTTVKFHVRTHTGEKLYACTMCEHAFAQPSDLKLHILRMHML